MNRLSNPLSLGGSSRFSISSSPSITAPTTYLNNNLLSILSDSSSPLMQQHPTAPSEKFLNNLYNNGNFGNNQNESNQYQNNFENLENDI